MDSFCGFDMTEKQHTAPKNVPFDLKWHYIDWLIKIGLFCV